MSFAVMVVDDDLTMREMVDIMLRSTKLTVHKVESGPACLERLRQGFHGIILMDIVMPEMDGWDTIRAILAEGLLGDNVICMLTGIKEPQNKSAGLEPYIFDYLAKPFSVRTLQAVVNLAAGCHKS